MLVAPSDANDRLGIQECVERQVYLRLYPETIVNVHTCGHDHAALGTLLGAFTIVGFESAANLAEETHEPEVVVPRAMWQAVLSVGVLGMLFLIAITALLGNPATLVISATPIADVINRVLGPIVGNLLLVMVVISIYACGQIIFMSATRLVWAMSRDERFPGWKYLHRVHPNLHTPFNATVFIAIVGEIILAGSPARPMRFRAVFGRHAVACDHLRRDHLDICHQA